jgi:hypothetical protein
MAKLEISHFPVLTPSVAGTWAPVLLRPILGSPEQYIIGVVAVGKTGFHIERANQFDRLECLFGGAASDLIFVTETALDALHKDVATRGLQALLEFRPAFSGIEIGECRAGESRSLEELARLWMTNFSSLYSNPNAETGTEVAVLEDRVTVPGRTAREPLPNLVMDYVVNVRPALLPFFAPSVRRSAARRRASNVHGVFVDFSGPKLSANFGVLSPTSYASSIDRIKRRLWDLKIDRDTRSLQGRYHQMIVQHLAEDQLSSPQHVERIRDGLKGLEEQADREEIRLLPMTSIEQIGAHVLKFEEAA